MPCSMVRSLTRSRMNVFRLERDPKEHFDFALVDEVADRAIWNGFNGAPLAAQWRAPMITAVDVNDVEAEPGDYAVLGSIPVFSLRALDALLDLIRPNGELLPLRYRGTEYFAYNVTRVIPALDEAESSIIRFPNSEVVMSIAEYAFRPEIVGTSAVFKIPQLPKAFVFITDSFVERAKSKHLTGFSYPRLWTVCRMGRRLIPSKAVRVSRG